MKTFVRKVYHNDFQAEAVAEVEKAFKYAFDLAKAREVSVIIPTHGLAFEDLSDIELVHYKAEIKFAFEK